MQRMAESWQPVCVWTLVGEESLYHVLQWPKGQSVVEVMGSNPDRNTYLKWNKLLYLGTKPQTVPQYILGLIQKKTTQSRMYCGKKDQAVPLHFTLSHLHSVVLYTVYSISRESWWNLGQCVSRAKKVSKRGIPILKKTTGLCPSRCHYSMM